MSWGCCYVACEAVKALSDEHLTPATLRVGDVVHWVLRNRFGDIWGPTWDQFSPDPSALWGLYMQAWGRGFLTWAPSIRAMKLLEKIKSKVLTADKWVGGKQP